MGTYVRALKAKALLAILVTCGLWALMHPMTLTAQEMPPHPPSPVITEWTWDPVDAIRYVPQRDGAFAQSFTLTWADDDGLYVAYNGGSGFDAQPSAQSGWGMARIVGNVDSFEGSNIPSSAASTGGEIAGSSAGSVLMVEHMLFMWVRGANHAGADSGGADNNSQGCRLGWSADGGRTWTWSQWSFAEFSDCVFINFGANYAGARDEYVYVVAPDSTHSVAPADTFALMRVPKKQMGNRSFYEFLVTVDAGGAPLWSLEEEKRGAVFTNATGAQQSSITYNAALGRYLWWQHHPAPDANSNSFGGIGIYDAPEPWGPWTTVFFESEWDVDPGESGTLPSKWFSDDGRTVHLAFASDEAFAVRRAQLSVAETSAPLPEVIAADAAPLASGAPPTSTVVSGSSISATVESAATSIPPSDGTAPEWADIPAPGSDQAGAEQPDASQPADATPVIPPPADQFASPLPTPTPDISALQSPLPPPADSSGIAAGMPISIAQGVTDTAELGDTSPLTQSQPLAEAAPIAEREPLSRAVNIIESQVLSDGVPLAENANNISQTASVTVPATVPAEPTPPPADTPTAVPTATPVPYVVAVSPPTPDLFGAIFQPETLIMMLLCLVSVSVSVLGFSALVVTVLYARAQAYTEQRRKDTQLHLYRTRNLPPIRTRWR